MSLAEHNAKLYAKRKREFLEDLTFILRTSNPSVDEVARRMQIEPLALERKLIRYGRTDLFARMTLNGAMRGISKNGKVIDGAQVSSAILSAERVLGSGVVSDDPEHRGTSADFKRNPTRPRLAFRLPKEQKLRGLLANNHETYLVAPGDHR